MTQVPMTLTELSKKWVKIQRTGYISEAISPTDFILGSRVQPIKAHSMAQVSMTLTVGQVFCQGHRQGQIFPKMGKKLNN